MTETLPTPALEPVQATDERERLPRWELVECTCPEYCERDHEQD